MYFARDEFFVVGTENLEDSVGCSVAIPVFISFCILFIFILTAIAWLRTSLIRKRLRKAKDPSQRGKIGWFQLVTIAQSWCTVLVSIALLIVPFVYPSPERVMVELFGIEHILFNLSSERWLSKLLRLGKRIIEPKRVDNESEDRLVNLDFVLKIALYFIRAAMLVQFISFCIVPLILPSSFTSFRVGIGMQAVDGFFSVFAIVYQYHRCGKAIVISANNVQAMKVKLPDGTIEYVFLKYPVNPIVY